ncbi:MAG: NAD(P)H-dependent glycerol-3-phosphate dehydrogenase, partial [Thermoanaerobaculia bacterium]
RGHRGQAGPEVKISVLGAGSWGTALAIHFARGGHDVCLWGRDRAVAEAIRRNGLHPRRLSGVRLPPSVRATADLAEAAGHAETLVVSVPCASFQGLLDALPARGAGNRRFVSAAKGIDPETGKRMSEVLRSRDPAAPVVALSGPTFAEGVAKGDPTAAVLADAGEGLARELQAEFSTESFRFYSSDDLIGVELCGGLKNVVAIAAGIVSGLGFGHNTLAALVTRGLAEIGRLVRSSGGKDRTVMGLAGVGDLLLTCTGKQSRNRSVGEQIGRGRKLADVLSELPEVAEGARTCLAVPTMAARAGVEAPIAEAVVQVLYEGAAPRDAISRLMTRALRAE